MKRVNFAFALCMVSAAASVTAAEPAADGQAARRVIGKNVYDVRFGRIPSNCETLLASDPDSWDFNFRPYGRTADLVSDPAIVRGVAAGKAMEGKPTGLRVSCDEDGWGFLVFCSEPEIGKALEESKSLPLPNLEMYFLPGDTDNADPAMYWQFYRGESKLDQFDWPACDRRWRPLKPFVREETRALSNGYVYRLEFPWESMWDRLPIFSDRQDNFWRLSVMRWVNGGMTWGGTVHEPARFGYIRWPKFTDAQKTAIMRRVLEKAWMDFRTLSAKAAYSVAGSVENAGGRAGYVRTEPYAVAQAKEQGPRSYINYCEDPDFRPTLEKLTAEAQALGPGIAAFASKPMDEQVRFYRAASDTLFNFRYAVEEAYEKQLRAKFVK